MDRHGIRRHVRWETEVTGRHGTTRPRPGPFAPATAAERRRTLPARAVISAVGQLNRPHIPDIAGQHDFAGPTFHSSAWDHSVDMTGKRVAMIGAGASGFQIAPTIAPDVEHLTVFQRTAQWMFPNPNYHDDGRARRALGAAPSAVLRPLVPLPDLLARCDRGLDAARVDPDYPDQQRAVSETNEVTRLMFTDWITSQVGDDPELLAKVMPDYPATGKRTLQDNGSWLTTLTRDNVELVRTGIDHIEAGRSRHRGRRAISGRRHRLRHRVPAHQAVVADEASRPGRRGARRALGRAAVGLPRHHGSRLPQLVLHVRAGHLAGHGGSLIFHSECQMRYITQCLDLLIAGGHRPWNRRQEKTTDWHDRSQAEMRTMVWSQPTIKHSYFKNSLRRDAHA